MGEANNLWLALVAQEFRGIMGKAVVQHPVDFFLVRYFLAVFINRLDCRYYLGYVFTLFGRNENQWAIPQEREVVGNMVAEALFAPVISVHFVHHYNTAFLHVRDVSGNVLVLLADRLQRVDDQDGHITAADALESLEAGIYVRQFLVIVFPFQAGGINEVIIHAVDFSVGVYGSAGGAGNGGNYNALLFKDGVEQATLADVWFSDNGNAD